MPTTRGNWGPWWASDEQIEAKLQTEEGQLEVLTELVTEDPPRRFSLCGVSPDLKDAGVVAYGLVLDDGVVLYEPDRDCLSERDSVRQAAKFTSFFVANLRVVWIDEPPPTRLPLD